LSEEEPGRDRTVDFVRQSTSHLLSSFRGKLDLLRGNDEVTQKLLRLGYDKLSCIEEALKFFNSDQVRFLAVDGTEFQEERLDMLVFFAGAYAYSGYIEFNEDIEARPPTSSNDYFGLSCAIPLTEEYDSQVLGEMTEGGTELDPQRVPQALMHFSEYYLAHTELQRDDNIRVLLLDRSVSGDIAHISWKMREQIRDGKLSLLGLKTSRGIVTKTDLELGRMLIENGGLNLPPARSQFLKFAAMQALIENGSMSVSDILEKLRASMERKTKLFGELKNDFGEAFSSIPENEDGRFVLKESIKHYRERLMEAIALVAGHIFSPPRDSHPFNIKDLAGNDRWITSNDLSYFTLLTIYAILKEAWKRNILVLGIVKDTAANELSSAVIPILEDAKISRFSTAPPKFGSDKMLLQTNSIVNHSLSKTPWRSFEYDVCFRTVSPKDDQTLPKDECRVEGAFKNVITSERMFVKAYFQLWSSESDPTVRSHVFAYDRPCYPAYDLPEGKPELLLHHFDTIEETIIPVIHFKEDSRISNLVMGILCSMGMEHIPEAMGHNYPLFLADKKAKWLESEISKACVAAVELEIATSRLDQQILYENKYRDYRTQLESDRKGKNRKK
jgi:hypothetical protein